MDIIDKVLSYFENTGNWRVMFYNKYLTEEAQKQAGKGPINTYRVRKPLPEEEVIGNAKTSDVVNEETPTERAAREAKKE